ncbi:uncharacterized protein C8Q71DRAFT_87802 [Rhodofomes roseus]|uniref:Proteophosphoglycan ppg4 n=1 Tax=Rhodofomes roseus TaxID=34475 RepID=A0ABQ8KDH9_9APHY|nr:uncharacterized protein C8Q71DRAFT_87802 [Rhodofomes roseus]KAH9835607.1 hypothetical protein C8Q71DRAFT_87802 [Rhodofomes roseus]
MPTLRWRRKTSTPLFPGAWPNSSASDQGDDQRLPVYSDDAPPQLPELRHLSPHKPCGEGEQDPAALAEEGWGFPIVLEKHGFEDDGRTVGARDRVRQASQPVTMSSPASTSAPLSASLSQASTFSDPTESEGVLTPQSIQGPPWLSPHTEASYTPNTKDNVLSSSSSFYHSFDDQTQHDQDSFAHDTTISTINANTTISSHNTADFRPHRGGTRAAYRDAPLLDFAEPLPLTRISLDWEAVTASSKASDASLQSPRLPHSPIQFSAPSTVGSPVLGGAAPILFNSEAMATTFFPVSTSSGHESSSDAHEDARHGASPPESSPPAYSLGTDSPVLPADVGCIQNPQPPINSPYTLMAADLDAFADAATSSSLSLPTSLHSALSVALLAEAGISERSPLSPPHLRAHSEESGVRSPSLVLAACGSTTEFPTTPGAAGDCVEDDDAGDAAVEEAIRMRTRRMSAPLLRSPHTPVHRSAPRERRQTLSSRVEVQRDEARDSAAGAHRPAKLPVLGKMRKLGGKFLSLFGGKGARTSDPGLGVEGPTEFAVKRTRRTAVTKIEFESEHPIPLPETPARDARASRRSLPLRMSKSPSSSPQLPQRDSFLPIEDPEFASKGILSIPLQHMRGSPSIQFKKGHGASDSGHGSQNRVTRARTLTAPAKPQWSKAINPKAPAAAAKQTRRFSLSSALSRSRLDTLKTTVVPHPPVPDFPKSPTCDQHPRRDEPVRPIGMIPPTGLDAKSSQSSLKGGVASSKKGKERVRPVSMVVGSGAARRAFLDHPGPQIRVQAPTPLIGVANTSKEDVRARHTSMLVGKEKDARRDMIEVAGSKFKMHRPTRNADQNQDAGEATTSAGDAVQYCVTAPEQVIEEASTEELGVSAAVVEAYNKLVTRERLPIERPGPDEVEPEAHPRPSTDAQAPRRRFSLSSAISWQRAIRARSMIVSVGRRSGESDRHGADSSGSTDVTATPPASAPGTSSSRPTHRRGRGSTFSTIIDAGVRFDILTPGFGFVMPTSTPSPRAVPSSPTASRRSNDADFRRDRDDAPVLGALDFEAAEDAIGMEEYPSPDSDLDSMSFAGTTTLMESITSSISMDSSYADSFADARSELADCSVALDEPEDTLAHGAVTRLGEPFEGGERVVKRVELISTAVGSSGSSGGGTPTTETVEREEERGFLRALGLELPVNKSHSVHGSG